MMVNYPNMLKRLTLIPVIGFIVLGMSSIQAAVNTEVVQSDPSVDASALARSAFVEASAANDIINSQFGTFIIQGPEIEANGAEATLSTLSNGQMAPFPHVAYYGSATGSGWPFVGTTEKTGTCVNNPTVACAVFTDCGSASTTCNNPGYQPAIGTPLNSEQLDAYAKFTQITSSPTPLSDGRTDVIPALRARNPDLSIFAYTTGHAMWCPGAPGNNSYPVGYYYRNYYLGVNNGDPSCTTSSNRWLWNQDGTRSGFDVNLAYRELQGDGSYRYTVAEAIAEAIYEHSKPARGFDGIFIDIFCPNYLWAENLSNPWDYVRAGYPDRDSFAVGWAAGHQREADRLRELAVADGHPDFPVVGNCGQTPTSLFAPMNGWMRENYPYQNGGTFFSNMLTYPWGFLHQDYLFRSPQINYVFTASEPTTQPYSLYNQQKMRFGLGSASLGNGFHIFGDSTAAPTIANDVLWWFDEYGVDVNVPHGHPEFGKAKNGLAYIGWLGQDKGRYYNMLLDNPNPDLLPLLDFEVNTSGVQLNNTGGGQATMSRHSGSAAVGQGALHVNITNTAGNSPSSILVNGPSNFTATNGAYYSLTFWAKASTNRPVAGFIGGAGLSIPVTTDWKQYQISVRANATGAAGLQFQLGQTTGDVWFDNIQIEAGIGNVFRRDFDHGTVLVNPYNQAITVQLEKPFRKILGTVNPTLNNGTVVNSVTLTPNVGAGIGDAIFLLDYDLTAPSSVTDLSAGAP